MHISDDDRMSLTTAISDEEEADQSLHNSPFKGSGGPGLVTGPGGGTVLSEHVRGVAPGGFQRQSSLQGGGTAASFNCTGAVRKAGFLSVKKWLLRKKHQVRKATVPFICTYLKCAERDFRRMHTTLVYRYYYGPSR